MSIVRKTTQATVALLAASLAGSVFAQSIIEEIKVTATKRESSIKDVPFSINAQTAKDIQMSGATDLESLSRNVAGLTVQNLGPGQSQVAIRGVSAGQIVRDQPGVKEQVGVYLDESVISLSLFTPDFDLYDLNRVETLRGPQGTLFGSGSVGGTIRYITNQPNPDQFEGNVEVDLNTVASGSGGGSVKGMVNSPLADGKGAFRLVAYMTQYGGYIDALGEGGSVDKDVNSGTRSGLRAAVAMMPNDRWTITPRFVYQEIDFGGFNRQEEFSLYANPYTTTRPAIQMEERQQYLLLDESFTDETMLADVTINASFDSFDFDFIAGTMDRQIEVSRDASALTGSVGVDVGISDAGIMLPSNLVDTTDLSQTTLEARISSNGEGTFHWLGGVFYSDTDRTYAQRLPTPGHDAATDAALGAGYAASLANGYPADSPYNADLPYTIEQIAVFGEVTFDISDTFHLTAGGRWYDFDEERTITQGGWFSSGFLNIKDSTTSDGFTPRLLASWEMSDSVTLNAQASQGFRLGGVNDPLNASLCTPEDEVIFGGFQSYGDETMWNYEVGAKSAWGNGVTFNVAAFYSDIDDLQVTLDAGSCSSRISFNVEEAHTAGVEFELGAQPTEQLSLSLAGSFLEAEFDSTVLDSTGGVLGGVQDGNRLASVPEFQMAATGTYYYPVNWFGGSDAFVSASISHVGDRITQPTDQLPGAGLFQSGLPFGGATGNEVTELDLELDAYTIVNFRAGVETDEWSAAFYINNFTDEIADLSFDRERGGRARLAFRTNMPRTIGITFRRSFSK